MSVAKRKIAPRTPVEEYAEDLEFELELAARYEPDEIPAAASLRHRITESLDDEAM